MNHTFKENVTIITGASIGIGRELAYRLADQGAWLALAARNADALKAVAAECEKRGGRTITVPTDVGDSARCERLIAQTVEAYGRIDTLVNNAGISASARVDEITKLTIYDDIIRVNYLGSVYCTSHALPHLKKSRGRIVALSSLSGLTGVPTMAPYSASKFALIGFFESLRVELMDTGVTVTIIYPGFVSTGIHSRNVDGDGKVIGDQHGIDYSVAMTTEDCVALTVRAIAKRKRNEVMTPRGKLGRWLKLIAPGMIDQIARKAVSSGK